MGSCIYLVPLAVVSSGQATNQVGALLNCTHFRNPTDEQLRLVDIYFLATDIICRLSTLNTVENYCFAIRNNGRSSSLVPSLAPSFPCVHYLKAPATQALVALLVYFLVSLYLFFALTQCISLMEVKSLGHT